MLPNSNPPAPPFDKEPKTQTGQRLVAAAVLIGLAIGGLALVDRLREQPKAFTPPQEPSQALIAPPAPESGVPPTNAETSPTPPPPQVINNETLSPPSRSPGEKSSHSSAARAAQADGAAVVPGKAYLIQVGVFSSPANAQALQKQLRRAGIDAHLETRVQLGPFKDKQDAEKVLARAKKLGINAVLVGSR